MAETRKGEVRAPELARKFGVARQTVTSHLRKLVEEGKLERAGSTKGARYRVAPSPRRPPKSTQINQVRQLKDLREDVVFSSINSKLSLKKHLSPNVHAIASYAFTEMLNNAIEHSKSPSATLNAAIEGRAFKFEIRDFGIGIFKNVMKKYDLGDEFAALEHVLKGKQTTAPQAHSGEGIFFTSRIADRFEIRSHRLKVIIDNAIPDTFVSEERNLKGTAVWFSIKVQSRKRLDKLFKEYTNENFEFDKNSVRIKITAHSGALSRSQARRLLFGMDRFRRIVFDFSGVKSIGQAFADEIFGVYPLQRGPELVLDYENANPAVEFMIQRALKTRRM